MKIHPEIGISLCRLTFSHRLFTKSGILPANSVISEIMIACTELKTQIKSCQNMQLVKGHTCLHKLARQPTCPPPGH